MDFCRPDFYCPDFCQSPLISTILCDVTFCNMPNQIQNAEVVNLDRWFIDIEGRRSRRLHMNWLPHRKLQMYNYFSIGVDAQIALNFHKARDSPFYIFSSRMLNKVGTNPIVCCCSVLTLIQLLF